MRKTLAALLAIALSAGQAASSPPPPPTEVAHIPVALLLDLNSGQTLYSREPERRFLPASTAKVMTVYVAFEEIDAGRLSLQMPFTVAEATARHWNGRGTSLYLQGGTTLDANTLLHGIATVSANDAAIVLAEGYAGDVPRWCALMNAQASKLGMKDSHFATPNGFPDGGATFVTARDLAILGKELISRHPGLYHQYFGQKRMTWGGITQESHDPTVGVVPGADGIKTGHTQEAGFNFLGSAERDGRRLIMVVAGASTESERAEASRALLEWGFSAWQERALFAAGVPIAQAQVQDGEARLVPLVTTQAVSAVFPKGMNGPISLKVTYKGPLIAPIAKGTPVAELEILAGNGLPNRMPLLAGYSVRKADLFGRLANGLSRLFS